MKKALEYQASKDLLKDKVILVTGGTSGIGKQAALSFAQHGAEIILLGRNLSKLEAIYTTFEEKSLKPPMLHMLDFESAKEEDFIEIRNAVEKEFGKLDGLLNNAGLLGEKKSIEHYDSSLWRSVLKVNLDSAFLLTKSLIPILKIPNNSSIIFTSSGVGKKGRAYWGAYAISKFAIEGLVQVLNDELEGTSSIRVNAINPGSVRTSMRAKAYPAENPKNLPLPKQIMNSYLFLLGEDSLEISGQSINSQ